MSFRPFPCPVTVHSAHDLTNQNLLTTMDPFTVLYLQKEKFKTKVHKDGGRMPQWEQSFLFNVDAKGDELFHCDVMNSGTISNDKIGRLSVDLTKLVATTGKTSYKVSVCESEWPLRTCHLHLLSQPCPFCVVFRCLAAFSCVTQITSRRLLDRSN